MDLGLDEVDQNEDRIIVWAFVSYFNAIKRTMKNQCDVVCTRFPQLDTDHAT